MVNKKVKKWFLVNRITKYVCKQISIVNLITFFLHFFRDDPDFDDVHVRRQDEEIEFLNQAKPPSWPCPAGYNKTPQGECRKDW